MMPKKKPYYPNNWKAYKDAPDQFFFPLPFDELMDWKIGGWEMPSSISCMIRETNRRTGKVKEYVYQRPSAARKKARDIMNAGESEFVVCTHEEVHALYPQENYDIFEDPLA